MNLKKFIKGMFKPTIKRLEQSNMSLELAIINPDSDYVNRVFGIDQKRLDELTEACTLKAKEVYPKDDDLSIAKELHVISLVAVHPNELAFMCYAKGRQHESIKSSPINIIGTLLGNKDLD